MLNNTTPMKYVAAGAAAVILAFGAYSLGNSKSSSSSSGTASAAQPGLAGGQQSGQGPQTGGQAPPGFGTPVTGATAAKVKAAALARYKGTVERVMKLSDGSYVVHVITSSGELHVTVSKDLKVTGSRQGGPGGPPGAPPSGAAPQSGGTVQ